MNPKTFSEDITFLKKYYEVVILSDETENAQVAICPHLQSKVMTSTAEGANGKSFGYINYKLIESQTIHPTINSFGGEDRFWIGPEGGQYSIFFKAGVPFNPDQAITPAPLDREPWELIDQEKRRASFRKEMTLENYSGTVFKVRIERSVYLLKKEEIEDGLRLTIPSTVKSVGFESFNKMNNIGTDEWKKKTGLLSIWILGMLPSSETSTIVFPFKEVLEEEIEPVVNDAYFGKVPDERIKIMVNEKVVLFKADGNNKSKIGLSPLRAKSVIGSYDKKNKVLTIVQFSLPPKATDYVNSMWEIQTDPYEGDVSNAYNDGPPSSGGFYELESSSPAALLKPGQCISHIHRTFHFTGDEKGLNTITTSVLGISLDKIKIP